MKRVWMLLGVGLVLSIVLFALNQRSPARSTTTEVPPSVEAVPSLLPEHPDTMLQARLAAIVAKTPGICAITAKHLGTGAVARVNGATRIPLMSVVKLPVAIVVLDGVDQGRWTLDTPITLIAQDMHPRGALGDRFPDGGGPVPLRELVEEMVTRSDNSSADALMRIVGGPLAVTAWLEEHGIHDFRVDRTERGLGNDWYGLPPGSDTMWTAEEIRELRANVPPAIHDSAARAMLRDPRDTGTPDACVAMLERLWRGELLTPAMTDTLKAVLARCETSPDRLPALLPKGTPVARKTGTGGMTGGITIAINDVGVIRLPDGSDVAIAVLVGEVRGRVSRAERTIAQIARAVFDAWSAPDSMRAGRGTSGDVASKERVRVFRAALLARARS